MGTLIDSSVIIAAERAKVDFSELLSGRAGNEKVAIAAITASEILHGAHRATKAAQRATREAFVESVLSGIPILPFDAIVARIHAAVWAGLAARGIQVGPHDLMIGATALAVGFDVATRDKRSFHKIPGLKVRDW